MTNQAVLRLARLLRFGNFPQSPTVADWVTVPWVLEADRQATLAAALEIENAGFDFTNPPQSGTLADLFASGAGGPLGSQEATIDVAVSVTQANNEQSFRRIRMNANWDIPFSVLIMYITELINDLLNAGYIGEAQQVIDWWIEMQDMFIF